MVNIFRKRILEIMPRVVAMFFVLLVATATIVLAIQVTGPNRLCKGDIVTYTFTNSSCLFPSVTINKPSSFTTISGPTNPSGKHSVSIKIKADPSSTPQDGLTIDYSSADDKNCNKKDEDFVFVLGVMGGIRIVDPSDIEIINHSVSGGLVTINYRVKDAGGGDIGDGYVVKEKNRVKKPVSTYDPCGIIMDPASQIHQNPSGTTTITGGEFSDEVGLSSGTIGAGCSLTIHQELSVCHFTKITDITFDDAGGVTFATAVP